MEKQVPVIIAELLFLHDCVIIPGFGGFVARHMPAYVHPGLRTVYPPSKSILFNKNLVNNDGLLANCLIEKFSFSYSQAISYIGKFAEECHRTLHQHLRLELENIGVLYLDTEKNIQFEPKEELNFLVQSFGLSPVYAQAIVAAEEINTVEKAINFADRKALPLEKTIGTVRRVKIKGWVALLIAAPFILGLAFLLSTNMAPRNSALASLNPFAPAEARHYKEGKFVMKKQKEENPVESKIILNENGTGQLFLSGSMKNIVFVYVNEENAKDKTEVKKDASKFKNLPYSKQHVSGNYQVVLGCFMEKNNADRLVNTLHTRNIHAGISGTNARGLFIVSAGGFDTKDSAYVMLNMLRQNFPSAWVMTK